MSAERGTCLHEQAKVVFPDGTTSNGSIWKLDTELIYTEVNNMWYALDATIDLPSWHVKADRNGNPLLQGLKPMPE